MTELKIHPVQANPRNRKPGTAPVCVTMRAYEVYTAIYGPQEALITDYCRGGFDVKELVAFLYAHSFPKEEWCKRFAEACEGLNL